MNELSQVHPYFDTLRRNYDARFDKLERRITAWQLDNSHFYQTLHKWFSLFDAADREWAFRLLLELDYYNESRLEDEFKLRLDALNLKDIHLTGSHQNALVVMPDNKVDSAYRHGWLISKLEGIPGKQVVDIDTLIPERNVCHYLVFINDTHGSGNQFLRDTWGKLEPKGVDPKKIVILAIAIAKQARELFRKKGFILIPEDDAKNAYQVFSSQEMTHIEALGQKLEPTHPLGYGNTALLVAYHFQCPNNTLPLIWSKGNARFPWNPLFEYRQKTKPATGESNQPKSPAPAHHTLTSAKYDASPKPDLTNLPAGAVGFLGREPELKLLDDAWADAGYTQMVELVATGGVGKTSMVKRWLDRLKVEAWRGAQRVYGWGFFSQPSDDDFLNDALHSFEVEHNPALSSLDKGKLLADAVAASRSLLVLDGVDQLQYSPGPMAGALRAPGLKELLIRLASGGQQGLCLLTTRERILDLEEYERSIDHPTGALVCYELGNLGDSDGARLLYNLGVHRAGSANIGPNDAELKQASREVQGHALTLSLLGSYLAQAHEGDIRQRDKVELEDADESKGGYAFQVMAAYETWFQREGERGARELATLRLLGFFDRPADAECLNTLRAAPPIPGLTEPLVDLRTGQWNISLSRLEQCGLIEKAQSDSVAIDAHLLVREYLAKALRERQPEAWREGHRRLYEHLTDSVPYHPDGLVGLQHLYQAVHHGCLAGLQQQAFQEVYVNRMLRGTEYDGFYSTKKLGASGANLGAVACFFEEPWQQVSPRLFPDDQAWLLNEAAFHLRNLGRLSEALIPMRAGMNGAKDFKNAAIYASNVSELELALGRVTEAIRDAEQSVTFADRNGKAFQRIVNRTTLADALHQQGERKKSLECFRDAEIMQAEFQPYHGLLYSVPGFRYCDLLLSGAERAAWQRQLALSSSEGGDQDEDIDACYVVQQRAAQTIQWEGGRLFDIALDHLNLGRSALLRSVLDNSTLDQADHELSAAVASFYAASTQEYIPLCLLTRAWFHAITDNPQAARADLDEAWQIASRGNMHLHMTDIHLHRARLFHDKEELKKARDLIEKCGYWRRKEELDDAEQAAEIWTVSP